MISILVMASLIFKLAYDRTAEDYRKGLRKLPRMSHGLYKTYRTTVVLQNRVNIMKEEIAIKNMYIGKLKTNRPNDDRNKNKSLTG